MLVRFKNLNIDEFKVNVYGGASDVALAKLYAVSEKTVARWRQSIGLPSMYWASQRHSCGTVASYQRGCRCDACTEANRERHRDTVAKMREKGLSPGDPRHGTLGAYRNWACRCDACRAVGAESNHEKYVEMFGEPDPNFFWTEEEDARLAELRPAEAARVLDRTLSAVYQRRHRLGLSSR
ncbi:hypothetical protein DSP71_15255 [Microbacterium sp. H6]|nr:hypothetical protein DSP71_15255 [Microbacterium sp. H6]